MARGYILQSGFVTTDPSSLNKAKEVKSTLRERLHAPSLHIQDTDHYYDEGVEQLYQRYHANPQLVKEFEFRELLIETLYRLYGEKGFFDWAKLQLTQRSVTFLHRRFLLDTVCFASREHRRKMEPYTYFRLLQAAAPVPYPSRDEGKVEADARQLFTNGFPLTTESLIVKWTRDYAAIGDLIESLHVIYGLRPSVTTPRGAR
jgi:hypothetical protein